MAEKYYAEVDKTRRLNNSMCHWEGKPVWVITRAGWVGWSLKEDEVFIAPLDRSNDLYDKTMWTKVKYTDDAFSYDAFPLGYLNYRRDALWTFRSPSQHQTQGLDASNFGVVGGQHMGRILQTKEAENMVLGIYPSFDEAFKLATDREVTGIAFDRNFSINAGKIITLNYRGDTIGMWSKKNKCFGLFESRITRIINPLLDQLGVRNVTVDY